jgi:hypothetical protein
MVYSTTNVPWTRDQLLHVLLPLCQCSLERLDWDGWQHLLHRAQTIANAVLFCGLYLVAQCLNA